MQAKFEAVLAPFYRAVSELLHLQPNTERADKTMRHTDATSEALAAFLRTAICPASQRKIDYFDTEQRGFLVEVRNSGGKTYYQRYTDERGRTHQFKLGPADMLTLGAAKRMGRSVVAQAITGTDPHSRRATLRSTPTLVEFAIKSYIPYVKSYKRSWSTDETILRVHILPAIGQLFLDQVDAASILSIIEKMRFAAIRERDHEQSDYSSKDTLSTLLANGN